MPPSHRSDPVNIPRHHVLDRFKRELHGRESDLTGVTPASGPGVETNPGRFAMCLYLNRCRKRGLRNGRDPRAPSRENGRTTRACALDKRGCKSELSKVDNGQSRYGTVTIFQLPAFPSIWWFTFLPTDSCFVGSRRRNFALPRDRFLLELRKPSRNVKKSTPREYQ